MRTRIGALAIVFAVAAPAAAVANQGVLVLAHNGTPEWNAKIKDLVAKVDAQKPAEIAFGVPTRSMIAPAVERLAKRGVTDVIAVPFFLSAPISPEHLSGHAVPIRIAPAAAEDPLFADIILSRAEEISRKPGEEVLVLVGFGSDDGGTPWVMDLAPTARRLNRTRRFASILAIGKPDNPTDAEQQQIRLTLERNTATGRRILVVPVVTPASGADPAIERLLQGFTYELAPRGMMADDRVVQWLAARTQASAR